MVQALHTDGQSSVAVMTPAAWTALLNSLPARERAELAWWPMTLRHDVIEPLSQALPAGLAAVEQSLGRVLAIDCLRLFPSLHRAFGGDLHRIIELGEAALSGRLSSLKRQMTSRLGATAWQDLEWAIRVQLELGRVLSRQAPAEAFGAFSEAPDDLNVSDDPLARAMLGLPLMVLGATSALDDDVIFDDELVRQLCARAYDHATTAQDGFAARGLLVDPFTRATRAERAAHVRTTLDALAFGFNDDVRLAVEEARVSMRLGSPA